MSDASHPTQEDADRALAIIGTPCAYKTHLSIDATVKAIVAKTIIGLDER